VFIYGFDSGLKPFKTYCNVIISAFILKLEIRGVWLIERVNRQSYVQHCGYFVDKKINK